MKITPLEIKKQQFKKVMRGYDTIEVDTFLDMLSNDLEDSLKAAKEMKERIIELETQLVDYKNMEKTLQQTLMQAQEASGKSIENSRKEADLIVREAEIKASQIVEKARMDFSRAKEEISSLKSRKESIVGKLKVILGSELDLIRALEIDDNGIPGRDASRGTGKDHLELDEILKKL
jgi:cell division initiation protein